MKINYSDITLGEAYSAYKDESLMSVCHANSMSVDFTEEDEETDCD